MRWIKLSQRDEGSVKQKRVFLLLPKCLSNECRWLEMATIQYRVTRELDIFTADWKFVWRPEFFIDNESDKRKD